MVRNPAARRAHHEAAAPDDVFIARVLEFTGLAKQHARALVMGGIVLVAGVLATAYYINYQGTLSARASVRLTEIRQMAAGGDPSLLTDELATFVTRFDGTSAAEEGRLLLAEMYLQQGETQQAVSAAQPLARDLDEPLGVSAAFLLAAGHEAAGQMADAEAVYLRISEQAPFAFQQRKALDDAARLRMQSGDAAGAAELYRRLIETTPQDAPDRPLYEMRLGEAEAALLGSEPAS